MEVIQGYMGSTKPFNNKKNTKEMMVNYCESIQNIIYGAVSS
jgi:hypothetical protein